MRTPDAGDEGRVAPPRVLERLLEMFLSRGHREFVSGDLREEYGERRRGGGRFSADLWYAREAMLSLRPWLGDWLRGRRRGAARIGVAPGRLRAVTRVEGLARDLRFAFRSIRRRPGHAGLIALTLAVGIGATTAVFTIVDHVLLRPPPYERPDEMVTVWNVYPGWRGHEVLDPLWDRISLSYPEYDDWRRGQTSFEEVAIFGPDEATLLDRGDPARIWVGRASGSLWPLLGIAPERGRAFGEDESGPSARAVALLSHELWTGGWGADPAALGATVRLDDRSYRIIGILPPRFRFLPVGEPGDELVERIGVWIPVGADGADLEERGSHSYQGIARLTPDGLTPETVRETRLLIAGTAFAPSSRDVRITPRRDEEVGAARGPLLLLLGAVGILMLIACVNVATLFVGTVASRRAELATRAALGAGRHRLLGQLAVEALLLGALGVAGGIAVGTAALRLLVRWAPAELALPPEVALDARIVLFAAALGVVTSLVFGLLPGLLVRRLDLQAELRRTAGRRLAGGRGAQRALVAAQFALSVVLLIGTGLVARSLAAELAVDPGFESEGLLAIDVALPGESYPSAESRSAFFRAAAERLRSVPGVTAVTGVSALPFSGRGGSSSFDIRGREVPPDAKKPEALRRSVLPGFHEALGVPLLEGRAIEDGDRDGGRPVVVVSRTMAERFWPGGSPLGEHIVRDGLEWEVVGVVEDLLTEDLKQAARPVFYTPFHHEEAGSRSSLSLVVSAGPRPTRLVPALREALWELDEALALDRIEPVPALLARATAAPRYRASLLSLFALVATLLSAIGAFGVVSRSLVHRTRDLGIRLALGAGPRRLVAQEVGRECVAVGAGTVVGLAAAALGARSLGAFLYGVSALDPATYALAVAGLFTLGLLATWLATRRIVSLDPASVLRAD